MKVYHYNSQYQYRWQGKGPNNSNAEDRTFKRTYRCMDGLEVNVRYILDDDNNSEFKINHTTSQIIYKPKSAYSLRGGV